MPILGCSPLSTSYLVPPHFLNFKGNWGGAKGRARSQQEWSGAEQRSPHPCS